MSNAKEEKKTTEKPANNVVFVGKRKRLDKKTGNYELVARTAPPFIQDAGDRIKLPAPEVQAKGFYHEDAARIIALFPDDYKQFVEKGK